MSRATDQVCEAFSQLTEDIHSGPDSVEGDIQKAYDTVVNIVMVLEQRIESERRRAVV